MKLRKEENKGLRKTRKIVDKKREPQKSTIIWKELLFKALINIIVGVITAIITKLLIG